MPNQRSMSKAVAAGNRATTGNDIAMQIPFFSAGRLRDGATFGWLRLPRKEMWLAGFRVDVRVPSGSSLSRVSFQLCRGDLAPIAGGKLIMTGVVPSSEHRFSPDFPLPMESLWTVKAAKESDEDDSYLPQDITLTYWLRHAPGPSGSLDWTPYSINSGVGFYQVGDTFVIG